MKAIVVEDNALRWQRRSRPGRRRRRSADPQSRDRDQSRRSRATRRRVSAAARREFDPRPRVRRRSGRGRRRRVALQASVIACARCWLAAVMRNWSTCPPGRRCAFRQRLEFRTGGGAAGSVRNRVSESVHRSAPRGGRTRAVARRRERRRHRRHSVVQDEPQSVFRHRGQRRQSGAVCGAGCDGRRRSSRRFVRRTRSRVDRRTRVST